jgi:antitoxin component YwqK of YwqJK toxin-antitoxin module
MMQKLLLPILASTLLFACGTKEKSEAVLRSEDSLSRSRQRLHADSLKRSNPLLIAPPDSQYTGSYTDKYPSGITKYVGYFRFGKRHGQWMAFYPNGTAWSEMHYEKGLRHGLNIAYFENGKKRYEGFYKNDQQDSVWTYYDSTGRLAEKVLFRNSRIIRRLDAK